MATPHKTSLTIPKNPIKKVVEEIAAAHKKAENELAHRMAMDVLGEPGDPLKAAIEKAVTSRVDVQGKLTKGPGSF